jgi:catechol 2,3-dioxygenase
MGHVHLKVAGIPETTAFYRDVLGFGLMAQLGAQAAFLSAGGYHPWRERMGISRR